MRDHLQLLRVGGEAQLEKLCLRENKGNFPKDLKLLLKLLQAEVAELEVEIHLEDYEAGRLEGADIANYAHMIILECERRAKDDLQRV